ncbi:hypothetical protein CC1G_07475 [Coprinopsis cinerea okayama7|uniref:Uncharacterized protein n=1 Tax=Coprinopsis cinerea (strain Okayama-7 / 130 / ATCC MYA-4618 / FGSC 9003) TaxID=240176 RepID=A8NBA5_COPC7|nr:hypothetical protein CC1G_07475 [Coprinopsis cinerea okayama7\|eukprot:XP_001832104.2 hypothetical protein CC1G_07475 [Coprinopsis cinerea okayama7\
MSVNTVTFVNPSTCERLFRSGVWLKAIGGNVSSFIIYLQTCALWGNRKAVAIPLFLLQVVSLIDPGTFVRPSLTEGLQWDKVKYLAPREFGGYCVFVGGIGYVRWAYLVICVTELTTVCFTLVKAFEHVRRSNSLWVSQLYRNGILYSLCMLILSLCNMIVSELPLKDPVYAGVMTR